MKLILEKTELLQILGDHFDVRLDSKQVTIRTDPHFEIEVSGLPLTTNAAPAPTSPETEEETTARAKQRADENVSFEQPPEGTDAIESTNEDISPAAILMRSKQLERELDANGKQRAGSYSLNPPTSFKDEL